MHACMNACNDVIILHEDNNKSKNTPKIICSRYLLYKSYILYRNLLSLLKKSQFHAGSYLTRGIIENRADLSFIIKHDDTFAEKFLETAEVVRKIRVGLKHGGCIKFPDIKKWTGGVSISNRVAQIDERTKFSYDLLCAYTHSSAVAIDDVHRKEERLLIDEQLLIATHNFLETCLTYLKKFCPDCLRQFDFTIYDLMQIYKNNK